MKPKKKVTKLKNVPKPPRKSKGVTKINLEDKKGMKYKLKVKKNSFLNKYYYAFEQKFIPKFNNFLYSSYLESLKYIKNAIWSFLILCILLLFGYQLTWWNYMSSIAICLVLTPITKFMYKIKKIED